MCGDENRNWSRILVTAHTTFDKLHHYIDSAFGVDPGDSALKADLGGFYIFYDPTRNAVLLQRDRLVSKARGPALRMAQAIRNRQLEDDTSEMTDQNGLIQQTCKSMRIKLWLDALEERVPFWYFRVIDGRYSCFLVTLKKRLPSTDKQVIGYPLVKSDVGREVVYKDEFGWQEAIDHYSAMSIHDLLERQQRSIDETLATPESEPGNDESHTESKQSRQADKADSLPEPQQPSGQKDALRDFLAAPSKDRQSHIDSDVSEYPPASTEQPSPTDKYETAYPTIAESIERAASLRANGRNQALPSRSNTNSKSSGQGTKRHKIKRKDQIHYNFSGA
ncbi:hypothetical protein ONS96_000075 [Cadophora gregata f. sp. sojae]|nr:hypothetical protein ONS96_000075 [Cadophora gregata f. sp. sojae]